jgi:iron-sulfur cluster assembly protein
MEHEEMATAEQPLTITISQNAANHVGAFMNSEGKNDGVLRVGVKGGGCSGLTYVLDFVDEARETDKVIVQNGVTLAIDKKSYIFLAGTELDYSGGLNGKGFIFNNPNAKKACGCGTSFSV